MSESCPPQVLYVEDDRINHILMEEVFRKLPGHALHLAETGAEALAELASLRPELVLIDMHLPDMNGMELLARLREQPGGASLRCIALSADDPCEVVAAARAAGFEDYWLKPIDVLRLKAALQLARG